MLLSIWVIILTADADTESDSDTENVDLTGLDIGGIMAQGVIYGGLNLGNIVSLFGAKTCLFLIGWIFIMVSLALL